MRYTYYILPLLALLFASCATVGTEMSQAQVSQIRKGTTTRTQMVERFGSPMNVGIQNGKKSAMWNYNKVKNKPANFIPIVGLLAGGMNMQSQMLMVVFDENDRVEDYTYTDATPEVKTGLF